MSTFVSDQGINIILEWLCDQNLSCVTRRIGILVNDQVEGTIICLPPCDVIIAGYPHIRRRLMRVTFFIPNGHDGLINTSRRWDERDFRLAIFTSDRVHRYDV